MPMMCLLYFSGDQDRTMHCSNKPIGYQEWPSNIAHGFGNSPPDTPLEKVTGGRCKFEEIINRKEEKTELVESLMTMLSCRDKYILLLNCVAGRIKF